MSYQNTSVGAGGGGGRSRGARSEFADNTSVAGSYIPDDISSVQSSTMGGVNLPSNFPPMFASFGEQWPNLPVRGKHSKNNGTAASVAGESVAASDLTDMNGSSVAGGVSLGNPSIRDLPPIGTAPADRLRRYVEGGKEAEVGYGTTSGGYD